MGVVFSAFLRKLCLDTYSVKFASSPAVCKCSLSLLTSSLAFVVICFLDGNDLDWVNMEFKSSSKKKVRLHLFILCGVCFAYDVCATEQCGGPRTTCQRQFSLYHVGPGDRT